MASISTGANRAGTTERHPSEWAALVVGIIFTVLGILGFFVTGFDRFAAPTHESLLGFHVNPLHNLVHLALGLVGLSLWRGLPRARTYGWILFAGYGLVFIYGLFVAGRSTASNFLSLNGADNVLHLITALVGLAIALGPSAEVTETRLARRSEKSGGDWSRIARLTPLSTAVAGSS